ncbi:MAG TPA: hypothetical protein VGE69_03890 [Pseudomonadales bacterium]
MVRISRLLRVIGITTGVAFTLQAQAQLIADVCRGSATVLSQQQTENGLDLQVEVTIEDCNGVCIGSLEYKLLFTDADDNEIQWHMTESWDWRELDGPFTLSIQEAMPPGAQLKEVQEMRIGRCSCSTRAAP